MAHLVELKQLLDEENTLKEISNKLNEQLTRLKVEEMALTSLIKMRDKQAAMSEASPSKSKQTSSQPQPSTSTSHTLQDDLSFEPSKESLPDLDLSVGPQDHSNVTDMSESERDDEDEYTSGGDMEALTSFLDSQSHS